MSRRQVRQPVWNLQPAVDGLNTLGRDVVLWLRFVQLALAILALVGAASWITTRISRVALRRKIQSPQRQLVAASKIKTGLASSIRYWSRAR